MSDPFFGMMKVRLPVLRLGLFLTGVFNTHNIKIKVYKSSREYSVYADNNNVVQHNMQMLQ